VVLSPRKELTEFIKTGGLDSGEFRLESGGLVQSYINLHRVALDPVGATLLAQSILNRVLDIKFTAIGAVESSASSYAVRDVQRMYRSNPAQQPQVFVVPKYPRQPCGRLISGTMREMDSCLLVHDVTTTENALLRAMDHIYGANLRLVGVVPVVDRSDGRVEEVVREHAWRRASTLPAGSGVSADILYLPLLYAADLGLREICNTE
jgi:orotate phosphoribosyltransferase